MGALNILAKAGKTAAKSDEALPLLLGRATPKTQAEIDALATRVARQMNEEHVRSGKPKDTTNLAGRSMKESQRLRGLDYVVEPTGAAKPSVVYQPKKGDVNVAIPGDQTISDSILRRIGDLEGINSVQEGGARYGLGKLHMDEPLFWASGENPAQMVQNKVNRVADFYGPERVVGQHLAMGPVSNNFAMHFADANLRAIDFSKMKPQQMQQFDRLIANGYYKKNAKTGEVEHINFPEWPGIADPEGALVAMRQNPELRKWFNDRMKTPKVTQPLGLPDGRDIQWAITEPELRNMEVNLTGLSAGEMVPGATLTDTAAHRTYDKGIRGTALGHQEVLTPFTLSFPDAAQHIASTQRPQDFTGTIQKVFPHQIVDEQYLDEMGRYRDLIKKYTGKKKGGLTLKASGGLIKAQLKALREEFAAKDAVIKAQQAIDEKKYLKDIQPNTLTPENIQKKVEETKPQKFDEGGAAFGKFPQMSLKRRKQDPEAAKNVPVDVARGIVSGVLGAPGDVESLIRMLPGLDEKTILPTSEDIEKRLPFKSDTPVSRAATGAGQIAGGFYTGPGSPFKLISVLPAAVKHGAEEFAKASAMGVPHVIKPKGGNWLTGDVEKAVASLKNPTTAGETPAQRIPRHEELLRDPSLSPESKEIVELHLNAEKKRAALDKWVDSNLTNYIKNQMATPDDPVRKLAEQGITHKSDLGDYRRTPGRTLTEKRKSAGFPAEGVGQSELARIWENLADYSFMSKPAKDVSSERYPWVTKLDPETPVYGGIKQDTSTELAFDHIIDVLREDLAAGRIRPEQLSKVSMEQAVRRTYEYDQELAKKMAQARIAAREGLPIYKEYPEGYRWIELNRPGSFAQESEAMGHSVRGYEPPKGHPDWAEGSGEAGSLGYGHGGWEAIKSGKAKIYSLVDPKGEPHTTIEVRSGLDKTGLLRPEELPPDVLADIKARNVFDPNFLWRLDTERNYYVPELGPFEPVITQIKGKQNRAPKEEYLPYVQDFVKSGKWGKVNELYNTGLSRADEILNLEALKRMRERNMEIPAYGTKEEYENLYDQYIKSASKPKGEKRGGVITSLRRNRNKTESVKNRFAA